MSKWSYKKFIELLALLIQLSNEYVLFPIYELVHINAIKIHCKANTPNLQDGTKIHSQKPH